LEPEVVRPGAAGVEATGAPEGVPLVLASPSTATALPPAVTGTAANTGICAPEPTPFAPEVVRAEGVEPEAAGADEAGADDEGAALAASPSTATELRDAVTGTAAETGTCAPEPTPFEPEVVRPAAEGVKAAGPDEEDPPPVASPRTATELPFAVTGAETPTGA
jgi:hypothetical protein